MLRRRFRLETVLRVRKRQEDFRALALAEVRTGIRAAVRQRQELVQAQLEMLENASSLTESNFDAADIRRYFQYERHLSRLAVETDARLVQFRGLETQRRAELEEATQRKKAIERLQERHRRDVAQRDAYWDQRAADEIASARAHAANQLRREA